MRSGNLHLRVSHFQRAPNQGNFSVERLFDDTRQAMPEEIRLVLHVNRHPSQGIKGRLSDAWCVRKLQGNVNHILGDVHYLAWFLPGKRTVLTVLDCVSLERLTGLRRWVFWVLWYWLPLQKVTAVTVISTFTRDSLLRWVKYPADRVHIIPPPLCPHFRYENRVMRQREKPRVLQVGTTPNKNIPRLLEALSGMGVTLVVVGKMTAELSQLAQEFEVDIENHVGLSLEKVIEQYRLADVVAFVSTYEGFGMPIVEAQATGRPVVTSNVCSMPETAGDAAIFVDPFNVSSIRRGIGSALNDQRLVEKLVKKGLENAKRFAPERIAEAYAELYKRVDSEANS